MKEISMSELGTEVKKIFLAGIDAIAVTAEKSAEIVDGLVKRVRLRWNRERS